MNKFIVVHAGARDGYEVSKALIESGQLAYIVTDDLFLRQERHLFPKESIKISIGALLCKIIKRYFFLHKNILYFWGDRFLGRKAGKLSKKSGFPLLSYSQYACHAFPLTDVHPKILFQFHPYALSNKRIYEEEMLRHPETKENLLQEEEFSLTEKMLFDRKKELEGADMCIAASTFTKKTLVENGMDAGKVVVVPYGVNIDRYTYIQGEIKDEVTFAFVGSYTFRKGINYLLEAATELKKRGYKFRIKMTGRDKAGFIEKFKIQYPLDNVEYFSNISHEELITMLHQSDVFVFPSLCEGFAFSIVEAMATGLPVITTNNTIGADIIEEGEQGFVIEPANLEVLISKMEYFILHPEKYKEMGYKASLKVKSLTWDDFRKGVVDVVSHSSINKNS